MAKGKNKAKPRRTNKSLTGAECRIIALAFLRTGSLLKAAEAVGATLEQAIKAYGSGRLRKEILDATRGGTRPYEEVPRGMVLMHLHEILANANGKTPAGARVAAGKAILSQDGLDNNDDVAQNIDTLVGVLKQASTTGQEGE